jgi:hypothetical protein
MVVRSEIEGGSATIGTLTVSKWYGQLGHGDILSRRCFFGGNE